MEEVGDKIDKEVKSSFFQSSNSENRQQIEVVNDDPLDVPLFVGQTIRGRGANERLHEKSSKKIGSMFSMGFELG